MPAPRDGPIVAPQQLVEAGFGFGHALARLVREAFGAQGLRLKLLHGQRVGAAVFLQYAHQAQRLPLQHAVALQGSELAISRQQLVIEAGHFRYHSGRDEVAALLRGHYPQVGGLAAAAQFAP
jgi:hypothetical protein